MEEENLRERRGGCRIMVAQRGEGQWWMEDIDLGEEEWMDTDLREHR